MARMRRVVKGPYWGAQPDRLVVWRLDRLGQSTQQWISNRMISWEEPGRIVPGNVSQHDWKRSRNPSAGMKRGAPGVNRTPNARDSKAAGTCWSQNGTDWSRDHIGKTNSCGQSACHSEACDGLAGALVPFEKRVSASSHAARLSDTLAMSFTSYYQDKMVLVTGGISGIGRALGEELCRAGAHVAFTGRRGTR